MDSIDIYAANVNPLAARIGFEPSLHSYLCYWTNIYFTLIKINLKYAKVLPIGNTRFGGGSLKEIWCNPCPDTENILSMPL